MLALESTKTRKERKKTREGFSELSGCDSNLWSATGINNGSILVIGRSGSGKTNAVRCIEDIVAESGARILVMNYNGTHPYEKDEKVIRVSVKKEGLPFPIFDRRGSEDNVESADELAESILAIFDGAHPIHERQSGVLRDAIHSVLKEGKTMADFRDIDNMLEKAGTDVARSIRNNFHSVFTQMRQGKAPKGFLESGTISVIDFDGLDSVTQRMLVEFVMSLIWHNLRLMGPSKAKPLYLVLDEFQDLNLAPDSVLSQLLREGRKYGIAVIMATQSLERFDKSRTAIIMQAARQLYFRPARSEVRKIAGSFGGDCTKRVEKTLLGLKQGQCLAIGCAGLNDKRDDEPVILTFPLWNGGECDVKTQND